jgi:hypothetical protein
MRELNEFNKIVIEKFSSRQAYTVIKGHYIPIVMGNLTDESVMDIEKRKYYIQSYEFTMLGFLIDENEFTVSPAVSRVLKVFEVGEQKINRGKKSVLENSVETLNVLFLNGVNTIYQLFDTTSDLKIGNLNNISSYEIYINNELYGVDVTDVSMNVNDVIKIVITKNDNTKESTMEIFSKLI